VLIERTVDFFHPGNKALQLALQAAVLGGMLGAAWKVDFASISSYCRKC